MPMDVTCECGTVNELPESANLAHSRCAECGAGLAAPPDPGAEHKAKKGVAAKKTACCFLCTGAGKAKRFVFYSGIMKGGTTHRMLSCTVTFYERWSDLTLHEIEVCRECQLRLWQKKYLVGMALFGGLAALPALLGLAGLLLLSGTARFVAPAVAAVSLLVLAGFFVVNLRQYLVKKPHHDLIEPLVLWEATGRFPRSTRTFMTTDQYLDRHGRGVFG